MRLNNGKIDNQTNTIDLYPVAIKMKVRLPHLRSAAFPLSRSATRLESWSASWTYHGARISSYQILMSVMVIVLVVEHVWTVKIKFYD